MGSALRQAADGGTVVFLLTMCVRVCVCYMSCALFVCVCACGVYDCVSTSHVRVFACVQSRME